MVALPNHMLNHMGHNSTARCKSICFNIYIKKIKYKNIQKGYPPPPLPTPHQKQKQKTTTVD